MDELVCTRCGEEFPLERDHTEIVRRDFVAVPQPTRVEYLCADCWRAYVEEFLGREWPERESVEAAGG